MFIVKNNPDWDAIDVIAGEMLNREYSLDHFVNGVAREELPQSYVGYPSFTTETRKYVLKAVSGTIYIPTGVDKKWFVEIITQVLKNKVLVRLDGQNLAQRCSHRSGANYCTSIITETANHRAFSTEEGKLYNAASGTNKFMWQICHISMIDLTILGTQSNIAIRRLAGIFWDVDDVTVHPHGALTFTFSKESFKSHTRTCDEKLTILNSAINPLMFELSEYWRSSVPSTDARDFIRDINQRKLVTSTLDQVEVKPVRVDDDTATMSTEICFRCKEPLYGDVYGLSGHVSKQDEPIVNNGKIIITPICPLCMHTTPEESPIESKFVRVIRLTWNKTPLDMINMCEFSESKKDICTEALKKVTPCDVMIDSTNYHFYLIGDKYVGFQHSKDFNYTKLVNAPFLEGRKACKVMVVQ
jgi:hypothetical protein